MRVSFLVKCSYFLCSIEFTSCDQLKVVWSDYLSFGLIISAPSISYLRYDRFECFDSLNGFYTLTLIKLLILYFLVFQVVNGSFLAPFLWFSLFRLLSLNFLYLIFRLQLSSTFPFYLFYKLFVSNRLIFFCFLSLIYC